MMKILLGVLTFAALSGGGTLAWQAQHNTAPIIESAYVSDTETAGLAPRRLIIGLDISKSNPLIDNPDFAAKVGARIADEISKLGFASEVHVRTFGSYDAGVNNFAYDAVLSVRNRPANVAAEVEKLVAGTPLLVQRGRFHPQDYTNILGFLDNMNESVGCSGMPTTILLASDGIEDSELAHLDDKDSHLPAPDGHPYRGCAEFEILGIGQGTKSPTKTMRLRSEWTRWAQEAGFPRFLGLNDW
jgi:hypothetical protein